MSLIRNSIVAHRIPMMFYKHYKFIEELKKCFVLCIYKQVSEKHYIGMFSTSICQLLLLFYIYIKGVNKNVFIPNLLITTFPQFYKIVSFINNLVKPRQS